MNKIQRTLKKIKIVLVLFLILGSTLYLIFRPKPDPCFNGIQDGKETGIDCGGFCDTLCPEPEKDEYIKNIVINRVDFTVDGKNNYDFIASVSNKNIEWGASSVNYKFVVYSESDEIIKEIEGKTYIMPAGSKADNLEYIKKYIVEDNVYMPSEPKKVEFQLSEYVWQKIADEKDLPELNVKIIETSDPAYWLDETKGVYMGRAFTRNSSKYSFDVVDIGVVLLGANDKVLAIAKTNQNTMNAGDGWGFEILWPNLKIEKSEIVGLEAEASTNVFDANNFIKDYKVQ
jgi:hypothetical protein